MNNKRGITLISLVITIIIIMILAGLTVSLLLRKNGIINKAQEAREVSTNAQQETGRGLNNLYNEIVLETDGQSVDPTPIINLEVISGKDNSNKEIQVTTIEKNNGITKIELIKDGMVQSTKTYPNIKTQIIEEFTVIQNGTYKIKVTTSQANKSETIVVTGIVVNITASFSYTGNAQSYTVPITGTYRLEVWGAGSSGKGGYSKGNITLLNGTILYIYVGGTGGYNGGGSGVYGTDGGGATDIRINLTDLYNRVIVAGGGGGYWSSYIGGAGGGTNGTDAYTQRSPAGTGGTQESAGYGGSFGQGGSAGTYCRRRRRRWLVWRWQ